MDSGRPSRTALRVALRRAAHQLYDARPLVFDDPFAVRMLGSAYAEELQRTPTRPDRPFSAALRAFLVVRSRYAEDCLSEAVAGRGVTQYVLLGAGLDTFSLRNRNPALRVFEVDHPATQAWKQGLLEQAGLELPAASTFVPVDFEQQELLPQLVQEGFDPAVKTFFAWLGVVPYLTAEAFRTTLGMIAGCAPGSGVVFDYSQPRAVLPPLEQLAHDSLAARVALAGEPFQLFFTPEQMREELGAFSQATDLDAAALNARYLAQRTDGLRLLGTAARLVLAVV